MKFDPITKDVYTDKGEFVKTLNCPYKMSWDKLEVINSSSRKCVNCDHLIIDTENLTDHNLLDIIKQNPQTKKWAITTSFTSLADNGKNTGLITISFYKRN
ncbi:hypothetical protein [Aequorivita sp. KMM 9714]|uniref:hypothetical protein n=1 Tax=Aequorivita sp. KMM 9714 TaxID=2707173 RepID=UPI0013EA3ECD|nr:hypothetical protein [Aequorivita sp. KMM 9714]NGX85394.1 hypothetical protein [Aequorivita sp. KMM 9714]